MVMARDSVRNARTDQVRRTIAEEEITVSTTSVSLTSLTYNPVNVAGVQTQPPNFRHAMRATIQAQVADIRYRTDGTAPTTDVGIILTSGNLVTIDGIENIMGFRAIRDGGADATIRVIYSR